MPRGKEGVNKKNEENKKDDEKNEGKKENKNDLREKKKKVRPLWKTTIIDKRTKEDEILDKTKKIINVNKHTKHKRKKE